MDIGFAPLNYPIFLYEHFIYDRFIVLTNPFVFARAVDGLGTRSVIGARNPLIGIDFWFALIRI